MMLSQAKGKMEGSKVPVQQGREWFARFRSS